MNSVKTVLKFYKQGKITLREAENILKIDVVKIIGDFARFDVSRYRRRGVPEVIYAPGKTDEQLFEIVSDLYAKQKNQIPFSPILVSKINTAQYHTLLASLLKDSTVLDEDDIKYFPRAKMATLTCGPKESPDRNNPARGRIALLCAGTADIGILDEAEIICKLSGCKTLRFNDVGVAGLHRLASPLKRIASFDPDVMIVAAGMEGALPSIIAGMSNVPVIGLPVSAGYGYGKGGEAALLSMLQACPLGIAVVNIDGGVAAGILATLFAERCADQRSNHIDS